ncbi:hypothetical protein BKA67DRAFT_400420 [Truncatella angustata]|uniref:Uncharacterized protein n=1 Tax=Truncatella angustata TaxID=152316 RepID=A0A9P8RL92_9PEZI|nr:uncharacterized protein BKA67DRAFT_400420 [Truncatella angustata]KAH6647896.1 hypothetical protein BKA67DRAFT_400420 [Truncatella angustata]
MCRRVFTHRMHHDVRQPMTIPHGVCGARAGIYANPLRTVYHRCELSIRKHAHAWVLNLPIRDCEFHSCCIVLEDFIPCEEGESELLGDGFEPELCLHFALEHRHEQLEMWCLGGPCDSRTCVRAMCNVEPVVTWRELDEIEYEDNWDPEYNRGEEARARWEQRLFTHMERLNILMADQAIHIAVLHDIMRGQSADSTALATAARNTLRVKDKVKLRLYSIAHELTWARH